MNRWIIFILGAALARACAGYAQPARQTTQNQTGATETAAPEFCPACADALAAATQKTGHSKAAPALDDFDSIDALRKQFNADRGRVRMVLLLSPTCPMCVQGAQWIQKEVLDRYPTASISLYVIWLPMLPSDARDKWNPELIHDDRATQFWDEQRTASVWFQKNLPDCPTLPRGAWDAVYLFDDNASWGSVPTKPVACATPIYRATDDIAKAVSQTIGGQTHPDEQDDR